MWGAGSSSHLAKLSVHQQVEHRPPSPPHPRRVVSMRADPPLSLSYVAIAALYKRGAHPAG